MRRTNKTQFAILGMLSIAPMSGYDIKRALDQSVTNFWTENYGHIYPMLQQLLQTGLIEPVPAAPPRKVYTLAPAGRDALLDWLEADPEPQPPRNELILQLFFGDRLGAERTLAKIRAERERQQERQAVYAQIRARLAAQPPEETRFWSMALRYGERVTDAILAWCDECIALESVAYRNEFTSAAPMAPADLRERSRALARAIGAVDARAQGDLSTREAHALAVMYEAEAVSSRADLQRALGIDKSNVTRLAQRLRAAGYVEQVVSDDDGRVRQLRLTERGRQTAARLEAQSLARFAAALEHVAREERPAVAHALAALTSALVAASAEEDMSAE